VQAYIAKILTKDRHVFSCRLLASHP